VINEDLRILSYNINLRKSYMNAAPEWLRILFYNINLRKSYINVASYSRERLMKIYVQKTKKQTFIHAATKAFMSDWWRFTLKTKNKPSFMPKQRH